MHWTWGVDGFVTLRTICSALKTASESLNLSAMKTLLIALTLLSQNVFADDLNSPAELARRCPMESAADPFLMTDDFRWDYTLSELISRFQQIYSGEKRLQKRAYWDAAKGAMVFPYEAQRGGDITLPLSFVQSIRRHVEEAFRLKYVDGLFFPDMGHSHFHVPLERWNNVYVHMPVTQISRMYELFFVDPELKIHYHTAEQLKTLDEDDRLISDRATQWRFYTRNLIGDNRGEGRLEVVHQADDIANTARTQPGYFWYSGGFNISGTKNGCFAAVVNGQIMRFDLSMYDLPYPSGGGDW